jgi:beta-N-acetylhexosaminidase
MKNALRILLLLMLLLSQTPMNSVQGYTLQDSATRLLDEMEPEERVGQLFVVTFNGNQPSDNILDLIKENYISGVVLRSDRENFADAPDTLVNLRSLIEELQSARYLTSTEIPEGGSGADLPEYIPLFVGISEDGGGAPQSQILSGLTPMPSQMAIGATWNVELSKAVGEVLGSELQALGINLLLGPSLDVLEDPRLIGPGDPGIQAFGGDPYWVSVMGEAYTRGIHSGSTGRVGVIAKHFPGLGSGDRPPEEEVATVRKSLNELEQIDLVPFFSVAFEQPGDGPSIADGFLTSNIRYQGFQGNIRATTRPLSLDREANDQLMALDGLSTWREGGGLIMSNALGSRAIRRFIDSTGQSYKGHLVARDAFLAGNDLLYLDNIRSDTDPDEITTIQSTLAFFTQKYVEDSVFAQRVDEAVLRILKLKLRLYGFNFSFSRILPPISQLETIGQNEDITVEVARRSATLISPSQIESEDRLAAPPVISERILFFTDSRVVRQCTTCTLQSDIPVRALEDAIDRLYGQGAAGQVGVWNLVSYSTADLENFLGVAPTIAPVVPVVSPEEIAESINVSDWIIFAILRSTENEYGSDALKLLLDTQQELVLDKKIVVFSFDVPYDLDATDISKIDVYYALYSKTDPFVEYAARLLFQEAIAEGHSPVSIPGVGYDLIQITSPDPDQEILITVSNGDQIIDPESDQVELLVGDVVTIETGVIRDFNENPVPDGTPVEFILSYQSENIPSLEIPATTKNGIASAVAALNRSGNLSIQAESLTARLSRTVALNIQGDNAEISSTPEPTTEESQAVSPTSVAELSTSVGSAVDEPIPETEEPTNNVIGLDELLFGTVGISLVAVAVYFLGPLLDLDQPFRSRYTIYTVIAGLVAYNYFALGLPGSTSILIDWGSGASLLFAVFAGVGTFAVLMVRKNLGDRV